MTEALIIVNDLICLYRDMTGGASLVNDHFEPMQRDPTTDGDAIVTCITDDTGIYDSMRASCAYAVQALKAAKLGEVGTAWSYVVDAQLWRGIALSFAWVKDHPASMRSELGKLARSPTVAVSVDARGTVKAWCEERLEQYRGRGTGRGLGALARAAHAARLVAEDKQTIRRWLTDWAKEWRAVDRWDGV